MITMTISPPNRLGTCPEAAQVSIAAELDDLLCRWHGWQHRSQVTRGFNDRALVVGEYLVSRQYDDTNGVLDDDIDDRRSAVVDCQVQEMLHPWRAAIYVVARNLSTGHEVWSSPRLPTDAIERAAVVAQARQQITRRLQLVGLIDA